MFRHQCGQDSDHHDVGAAGAGFGLGIVQAGAHLGFQVQTRVSGQRPRRHVEFDVVRAQFLLVGRIRDGVEHVAVRHRGLVVGVDQVAFDFHAGERTFGIEPGLRKHRLEDVQTQPHLVPVFPPLCVVIGGALDFFAHTADATGLPSVAQVRRLPGVSDLTPRRAVGRVRGIHRRHRPGHHQHPVHDLRPRRARGGPPPARARADPARAPGWVEHDPVEIWERTCVGGAAVLQPGRSWRRRTWPRSASRTSERRRSCGTAHRAAVLQRDRLAGHPHRPDRRRAGPRRPRRGHPSQGRPAAGDLLLRRQAAVDPGERRRGARGRRSAATRCSAPSTPGCCGT